MVTLTSSRVILRPYRDEDLDSLVWHANNKKIWRNLTDGFPHPYTEASGRQWLEMAQKEDRNITLAIEIDHQVVGGIGIVFKDDVYRIDAVIGYWLSEEYWGRGFMSESVSLLVDYVFQHYPDIITIYAEVFDYNPASARVLQKCGFHLEAIHKNAVIKDGKVIDEHRYVKFKPGYSN